MQHWGGCYGAYTENMKTHCHGSCPQFCRKLLPSFLVRESHLYNNFKSSDSFLVVLIYVFAAKPCEWGSWTEGSCDRTCGGGKRVLTRRKLIQEQNNGECLHGDTKAEICNTQQCPGESFLFTFAFGQCLI